MSGLNQMIKKSVLLLTLATLGQLWVVAQMHAKRQRHRLSGASKPKPAVLQTWEGEGGALPVSGPQLGPDPSGKPPSLPAGQDV